MKTKNTFIEPLFVGTVIAGLCVSLQPFIKDLIWGAIFSILAYPVYLKLKKITFIPNWALGLLAIFLVVLALLLPALFTLHTLSGELSALMAYLNRVNGVGLPAPSYLIKIPLVGQSISDWWQINLAHPGGLFKVLKGFALTQDAASFVKDVTTYIAVDILHFIIAFIAAVVLLSGHVSVIRAVHSLLGRTVPTYQGMLFNKVPRMLKATAVGLGSVAFAEGVILGVAYFFAGAPFPLLLGVITAYLALIPGGAPFSFTTVSLIVLAQGNPSSALGLFAWGAFELFMVDKFIRPKLIGKEVGLPFLAVLLSLLGGVATFGVLGLFIGPVLMTIVYSLLQFDGLG